MPAARPTPSRRAAALVIGVVALSTAVSQAFGRFTYSLLFTDVRDDFGLSNTAAGAMGSANLAAYLGGSLVVSLVVGRLGAALVARIGLVGVTTALGLLAWAPNPFVVAAALVATGGFAAGVWVTAPALASALVGPSRRGLALGLVLGGVGVGIVAASALDAGLSPRWREVYRWELMAAIATCAAVLALLRDDVARPRTKVSGLAMLRTVPGWRPLVASYGCFAFAMSLVMTFVVGSLEDDAGWSAGRAATAFSMLGVGTLLGGPIFGPLADAWGRVSSQVAAFAVMAAGTAVLIGGVWPLALLGALAFGTAFTGVPVTVTTRVRDALADDAFSAAYGLVTLVFGAGLTLGPQTGGAIADATGSFRPVLVVSLVATLVGAGLTYVGRPSLTDAA